MKKLINVSVIDRFLTKKFTFSVLISSYSVVGGAIFWWAEVLAVLR